MIGVASDILALVLFAVATVVIVSIPSGGNSPFSVGAKSFLLAAVAANTLVTIGSALRPTNVFPLLHDAQGGLELLWVPFSAFMAYSLYTRQQVLEVETLRRSAVQANEMLESIMHTTQTGIVVLDPTGAITFANGAARQLLDLEEAAGVGGWISISTGLDVGMESERKDFAALCTERKLSNVTLTVTWPNGWRRRLLVNTEPALREDGRLVEVVAAFVETEPWRTAAAQ